jgi:hypothetical protein
MIPLLIAASLLTPSDAPCDAIRVKDGPVHAAAFVDAVRVNIRPEHRERLAPIVAAIRYAENGRAGREFGILHKRCPNTFRGQAGWCAATVQKNYDRWVKVGRRGAFIVFLGKRYCPVGADNDPDGLNKHWIKNVTHYSGQFGRKRGGSGRQSESAPSRHRISALETFLLNAPTTYATVVAMQISEYTPKEQA